MAATAPKDTEQFLDELICSICRDYFTDPVITSCDHNFCRGCITRYWERGEPTTCPECRNACLETELIPNVELRKTARKAKCLPPAAPESAVTDSGEWKTHGDAAKPFSEEPQSPIYEVCKESQVHKDHTIICPEEAAQDREATGRPKTLSWCEEEKETFLKPSKINSESQTEAYKQGWLSALKAWAPPLAVLSLVLNFIFISILIARPAKTREPFPAGAACPNGWVGYRGKCYYFSEPEANWTDSQKNCSALGASLAGIDSQQEMDFLGRSKGIFDHWIGLHRELGQTWKWANGTDFNNWFPIAGDEQCTFLSHNGVASSSCQNSQHWICSKPAQKPESEMKSLLPV